MSSIEITDQLRAKLASLQELRRQATATDNPITGQRLRQTFREESMRFLDFLEGEIRAADENDGH